MILTYMKVKSRSLNLNLSEYLPDWNDPATDQRLLDIKDKFENLEDWERNILGLYAKLGSYSKVGEFLLVDKTTAFYAVKRIKNKLLN